MNRVISFCVAGLYIAVLGACAAPASENQQAAGKPQAASPRAKDEVCEETTGSRFKRCAGGGSGSGMVSGGQVTPGTPISTPAGLSSK
jgi:hypothetical protein